MENKKTQQTDAYPGMDLPPYSGPPPRPSYPGLAHSTYPVTNQPQVTLVQPVTTGLVTRGAVIPAVVIANNMGPYPSSHFCRFCNQQVVTRVERTAAMKTHVLAAILCLLGFWPCVWIPYFVDSCNNAEHYCPNCNSYIGTHIC